jgi:ribosomal-protein-alanine N-acetyltransferase
MIDSPASEFKVRHMTETDVPQVYALDVLSFSLPWTESSFRYEASENTSARGWVTEYTRAGETRLAAMLVLWIFLDEAHIATLAVHPEFRRRGIANQILQIALNAAYDEGAERALLEVRASNLAARELYEKFGFEVVGRRTRYYHDNNEDALLMTLEKLQLQPSAPGRQP